MPNALRHNNYWTHFRMTAASFELTEDVANAWIAAVNDLRLALGTMLDIRPDGPDRLPDDHPMAPHLDVYQWLTVLQEYLVLALMGVAMNSITDVAGILVGHHHRLDPDATMGAGWASGVTVVLTPPGTVGAVDSGAGRPAPGRPICWTRPTACATSTRC